MRKNGFTLIELLIVVAIIAILAAIAVPNFLEAQVRSKVSRCKADQRSVGLAVESYALDNNGYPPGRAVPVPIRLTTPIAYITAAMLRDPFLIGAENFFYVGTDSWVWNPYYQYAAYPNSQNPNAGNSWHVASMGPARTRPGLWANVDNAVTGGNPNTWRNMTNMIYDPTNGTVSVGVIMRSGGEMDSRLFALVNR